MPSREALSNMNDDHTTETNPGARHNSHTKYKNNTRYTNDQNNYKR